MKPSQRIAARSLAFTIALVGAARAQNMLQNKASQAAEPGTATMPLVPAQPTQAEIRAGELGPQTALLGPFRARAFNFVTRRWETFPVHNPFEFHIVDTRRAGLGDGFDGVDISRVVLSGSENFLAPADGSLTCPNAGCDRNQNVVALGLDLRTHAPAQIGGAVNAFIENYAPGDSISINYENHYTGYSRAADEGARFLRMQTAPEEKRWGGRLLSVQPEPLTAAMPNGNVAITVERCDGCDLDATAEEGSPILNLTRAEPAGNVTFATEYKTDPRFVVLTVDTALDHGKPPSHWTNLTRPVDTTPSRAACGTANAQPGPVPVGDPFLADEAGQGNASARTCFQVGSTAGLTVGMVVVIGGDRSNIETTRVLAVVDATHFVANARMPHAGPTPAGAGLAGSAQGHPGEVVAWGGYAGYAAGFVADIAAPQGMPAADRARKGWAEPVCNFNACNHTPYYQAALVMGSLPGNRLVLWVDSEATGLTLNTFGLMANHPVAPARFTAQVQGGHVVALTRVAAGDYREQRPPAGTGGPLNSGQKLLPPPRMTLAGCRVAPVFHVSLVAGEGLAVEASVDTTASGEGCPDGASVPVDTESSYPNPLVLYPAALVYRAIRPAETAEVLSDKTGFQLWMPPSGDFRVGDQVMESTWPLQQVGDLSIWSRDIGFNSGRFGPYDQWIFRGQGNGVPFLEITNQTPPYRYYSDVAHGFAPTLDGGGFTQAPSGIRFSGAYANVLEVMTPPRRGVGAEPGSFVSFRCQAGQYSVRSLCEQGVLNPFYLFTTDSELGGAHMPGTEGFLIDPVLRRWTLKLGGNDGVIATDASLQAHGTLSGAELEVRSAGTRVAGIDAQGMLTVAGCVGCTLRGEATVTVHPLAAGACLSSQVRVPGASVGSPVAVSPADGQPYGALYHVDGVVATPGMVTVEVCPMQPLRGATLRFNLRVIP
jgi:hypothetical protein